VFARPAALLLRDKERLLAESCAATASCAWSALDEQLAPARRRRPDVIDGALVAFPNSATSRTSKRVHHRVFELFTLSRRNQPEIASEFARLLRRTREQWQTCCGASRPEARCTLRAEPEARGRRALPRWPTAPSACACSPNDHDFSQTIRAGVLAGAALLD